MRAVPGGASPGQSEYWSAGPSTGRLCVSAQSVGRPCPLSLGGGAGSQCSERMTSGKIWHSLPWKTPERRIRVQIRNKEPGFSFKEKETN